MGTLTALLLATPIFGLSLTPPPSMAMTSAMAPTAQVASSISLEVSEEAALDDGDSADASASEAPTVPSADEKARYVHDLKRRASLAGIHRTLGIATWAMTAIAVAGGTVQYRNLYGAPFATKMEDTPCVQGNSWPNQEQCYGAPLFHAITGFAAGGLYFTTAALAVAMPDPDHADQGNSKFAKTVRTHKILRWVHLTGMVTQMALGIVMANPGLGLDRANDYDTLKLLSGIHLASGYITLGALTWAGTIMLF
ncbi:MAG: hypothetical protein RL385_4231 [Pseudomonadota bacterium]|jgi:hypothetical protein